MTTSDSTIEAMRERLRSVIPAGGKDGPTQGVNHIAVFAKDLEAAAKFYSEIMDMPVIQVTANRDAAESTHMNVAIGNGMSHYRSSTSLTCRVYSGGHPRGWATSCTSPFPSPGMPFKN